MTAAGKYLQGGTHNILKCKSIKYILTSMLVYMYINILCYYFDI